MHRRYRIGHLILASVIVLGLMPLMVCVDAQARIAFMSHRDGNPEIYVMDTDGGNLRRLTDNSDKDFSPSWSPDGKRIAFISDRDGHVHARHGWSTYEIYVMNADGSNSQNVTNNPFSDRSPSWSPDGQRIVFTSARDEANPQNSEIYVMDAEGQNQRNLTKNSSKDWHPSWSPDGKRVAFLSNRDRKKPEIHVMDIDGGNPRNLTQDPHDDTDPAWYDPTFAVDPAGKQFTMWGRLKRGDR